MDTKKTISRRDFLGGAGGTLMYALPQQLVERAHLTPALHQRSTPGQRYLLNIEDAAAVVFGYPPMPRDPRVWTAFRSDETPH